jgi:hypothetical protein
MQTQNQAADSHAQLRTLYRSLLEHEGRYHEFKQLLAMYPAPEGESVEHEKAAEVRRTINARIGEWIGQPFTGLIAMQVSLWKSILIEERFNVALSPWKEANHY